MVAMDLVELSLHKNGIRNGKAIVYNRLMILMLHQVNSICELLSLNILFAFFVFASIQTCDALWPGHWNSILNAFKLIDQTKFFNFNRK